MHRGPGRLLRQAVAKAVEKSFHQRRVALDDVDAPRAARQGALGEHPAVALDRERKEKIAPGSRVPRPADSTRASTAARPDNRQRLQIVADERADGNAYTRVRAASKRR